MSRLGSSGRTPRCNSSRWLLSKRGNRLSYSSSSNKLRLQPDGRLRVCLASEQSVDVREILRREHTVEDVRDAVRKAIQMKPAAAPWNAPAEMWKVGG